MKKQAMLVLFGLIIILIMILSMSGVINTTFGLCVSFALFTVFALLLSRMARNSDVKFVEYLMLIFAVVSIILFVYNLIAYLKITKTTTYKFQITASENDSEKQKLFEYNNKEYYSYKIGNLTVNFKGNEKMSLENALKSNKITLDEIISLMVANNGTLGYKIYYDGGQEKYKNDQYSLVICENNNHVIFSTFDYEYNSSICE